MPAMSRIVAAALVAAVSVNADVYMHNPRGSNNRLNERSANRNNGNRMFDSQVRLHVSSVTKPPSVLLELGRTT